MISRLLPIFLLLALILIACRPQQSTTGLHLTVSPAIDQGNDENKRIIASLEGFLRTREADATANAYWLSSDFERYVYPYADLQDMDKSRFGEGFFQPVLMEILPTNEPQTKIVKLAYIGAGAGTEDRYLKAIFNLVAHTGEEKVQFSRYTTHAVRNWTRQEEGSITYFISPGRQAGEAEMARQQEEADRLAAFLGMGPVPVTYYSCSDPAELFRIKGFDYHPMMYADSTGGFAEYGRHIFSGNASEYYTHELVHIYTYHRFPGLLPLLDEGLATLIGGSGKESYQAHRNRFRDYLGSHPGFDPALHTDPYERLYAEGLTPVPYMTGALVAEYILRTGGREALFAACSDSGDLWTVLHKFGLTKENLNETLRREITLDPLILW